uniref:Phosphatase domain containing paladin 1a n=1 Tax=Astyanax mexicanus TaxID=7994 RepID=A0A3B1J2D6_ASTMX
IGISLPINENPLSFVIKNSMKHKYCSLLSEVIFFCVREEPLLFLRLEENFVPYTPRRKENLHENLHDLSKDVPVENLELNIRKELHDFARLNENVFYVYNDIEHFKDQPQKISISCEEDIHVTEEVYKRPLFTMPAYRYYRLPLPMEGAPMEEQFDAFVNILRENPSLSLNRDASKPLPALLFSCQVGVGRTNLGMILGTLVMERVTGEAVKSEPNPQFQIIQTLISKLPNGQQIVQEVDRAIELCSEMHDIKESQVVNFTHSTKLYFLQRALQSLEHYVYLILFNTYLHQQVHTHTHRQKLKTWLCSNAWVAPADLITKGARVLVSRDEYLAPDVLSTMKEMKVPNFRRVPKMPVYGMAQPTSEATGVVLAYLMDEKGNISDVLWVNVQEELVVEANGQMFSPREPSCLDQYISLHNPLCVNIRLETGLKEEILKAQKWLEVTLEQEKQMKMFKSCQTLQEIFNQHKSSHQGLEYQRVPLPECAAPTEQVKVTEPVINCDHCTPADVSYETFISKKKVVGEQKNRTFIDDNGITNPVHAHNILVSEYHYLRSLFSEFLYIITAILI